MNNENINVDQVKQQIHDQLEIETLKRELEESRNQKKVKAKVGVGSGFSFAFGLLLFIILSPFIVIILVLVFGIVLDDLSYFASCLGKIL
jgi:hypothetical protein